MLSANHPYDITGTVRLDSAASVCDAVTGLLCARFPSAPQEVAFLRRAFDDIEAAFWGEYPGYLRCDTPYHDLRHSLDTALLVARMIDGYQRLEDGTASALNGQEAVLAVFLALYHDIGFLRRTDEAHMSGAQLMLQHETRSAAFARQYLATGPLAGFTDSAELIHATNFAQPAADVLQGHPLQQTTIARMIGSADLISQISDRCYLERCRDFLYGEFAIAGTDRTRDADGQVTLLYRDGNDLLAKTPAFYDHLVKKRLEQDFANIDQVLVHHFGGNNPYASAMQANLDYLRQLIANGQLASGLRRHPVPLIPESGSR